jgi:hypothetical protein
MADDRDQFRARNFAAKFHAADDVVVQHVAGDSRAEDVADPLVEDNFNGLARVQAAQYHREWSSVFSYISLFPRFLVFY